MVEGITAQCCDEKILSSIDTKSDCLKYPEMLSWRNAQWNFDNIFYGIHTLFTVATLSGKKSSNTVNFFLYFCVVVKN